MPTAVERQLRFITDHVPVFIVHCDADGRYRFVNAPYAARFGLAPEALVGKRIVEVVGEQAYESFRRHVEAAIAGERVEFEEQIPYSQLGPRWIHAVYVPEPDRDGRRPGFVAVIQDVTQRRQAEEALREREAHLRAVVDTSPECVKLVARDGTLLQMNAAGLAMVGAASTGEVVGRNVYELIAPEHREAFRAFNERVCDGEKGSLEFDVIGVSGRRRHMESHAAPLRLPDGSVVQLALTRDVTERRQDSLLFEAQRHSLELVVRGAPLAEVLTHLTRTVEALAGGNVAASVLLLDAEKRLRNGASPSLPAHYLEAIDGLAADPGIGTCAAAAATGRIVVTPEFASDPRWEGLAHLPIGIGFTGAWSQPILARDGRVLGTFGTYFRERRGPTERERRTVAILASTAALAIEREVGERTVRESEERYRTLLRLMPVAVYTCDAPGGLITFYNDHAVALWGRTPKIGDTDQRFCGSYRLWRSDGTLLPHAEAPMALAVREGREFRNQEVVIERTDGSRITVLVNIDPLRDERGRVTGAINVFHDTTALKQAEQALREADRRKDEFLATLSHELRNPLAPLRNALSLLRLSGEATSSGKTLHDMMERQVNHLVRLVDDLLEMSRISRGTVDLRKERVALEAIVRNAIETSEPLIREAGHTLERSLPQDALWLEGDAVRLAQILANLLNNAAKYTPPGGRIGVEAVPEGRAVRITVSDNGSGIAPQMLPRLFEMFTRGDHLSTLSQSGLGIGLALSRRLAEMHGGTLEAASEGLGKGSRFTLRLPLADAPARATGTTARVDRPLPQKRILVVDDNRDAVDSLGMLLRFLGADVRVARDGQEALAAYETYQPSIVLLDIGMPGMDGCEVARRIRARYPARRSALVALTGWGQEEDRRRVREAGFDHHLVKPAELEALQALIAMIDERGVDSGKETASPLH